MLFRCERATSKSQLFEKRLRGELLEDRLMLATFQVGTLASDSSSMVSPGPGQPVVHTLRSAIAAAEIRSHCVNSMRFPVVRGQRKQIVTNSGYSLA